MASAIVLDIEDTEALPNGNVSLTFRMLCLVVGKGDFTTVSIEVVPTDTPAILRAKLNTAAQAEFTRLGYAILASELFLPSYQKGG